MNQTKRIAALLLTAVLAMGMLTGCKDTMTSVARKVIGGSDEVQEEDTTKWADPTGQELMLEGITDASAKYTSAVVNGSLNIVFNGIWTRKTDYFSVPGGTLTISGYGAAEGTQKFKIAVWQKVDGGTQYVPDSTYYFKTDGTNYSCVVSGLDPNASYRLTISYDSSRYYLYGGLKVEGIG